jgi:protein-L-isoaspartate(D-aspartate) O-methyltransferase
VETTARWRIEQAQFGAVRVAALVIALAFAASGALGNSAAPNEPGAQTSAPGGSSSATGEQPAKPNSGEPWVPPRFTERQAERDRMVEVIISYGLTDPAVLDAMRAVPRHEFVPESLQSQAYDDAPLPIGHGQTISQPYVVAEMTRQLRLTKESKVLEVGTGSGYQAAVLSHFTERVFTIEIIKPLAEAAEKRLARLKYGVVHVRCGDGYYGWAEAVPFDAIIVTCAVGQVPPPLLKQLAPGGRMVVPVGASYAVQSLILVEKDREGALHSRDLMPVRFVPLLRKDESAR